MKKITNKERKCIRYLSGEMSLEDRSIFEIELSLDKELNDFFKTYNAVWNDYDKEEAIPVSFQENAFTHKNIALVSTFILLGSVLFISFSWFDTIPSNNQVTANNGQRKIIYLSDSSKVILNSNSTLYYPTVFEDSREVKLDGEAYFEITKNPDHPFIVNSQNFKVKVLGTHFSVNNRAAKKEIALEEGKVEFIQNNNNDKITLSPQERLIWDTENNQVHKENFDSRKELAWTTNTLLLDNVLFKNALKDINQFYGVHFVINDDDLLNQHITGSFKDQNLDHFIQSLEFIASVEIQELQEKIFLIKSIDHD